MKIILSLLQLFIIAASLHAAPISPQKAVEAGSLFLFGKEKPNGYTHQIAQFGQLHIINYFSNGHPAGFVVMGNDDSLPSPILAFAKEGSMNLNNPTIRSVMNQYSKEVSEWPNYTAQPKSEDKIYYQRKDSVCLPFLPTVYWHQKHPYNLFMPVDNNGQKTMVGCAPIAIAQILNYYRYPQQGKGISAYSRVSEKGIKFSFVTNFDSLHINWNTIVPKYTTQDIAGAYKSISPLLYYCAMASETVFGASASVSYTTPAATSFFKHFGYHPEVCHLEKKILSDKQFMQFLHKELEAKRPVLCCGHGHFFVCDGFINDYFHFDWGWEGAKNGYFKLSALPAAANNFQLTPYVIAKIRPLEIKTIQKTILLSQPGTLAQHITDKEQQTLTSLTIAGPLNGKDVLLLRKMAGATETVFDDGGELRELNLSKAKFVDDYEQPYYKRNLKHERWKRGMKGEETGGEMVTFDFETMTDEQWQLYCRLGGETDGNREWKFVKDGSNYYLQYYTKAGLIGEFMFKDCRNLCKLILPGEAAIIRQNAFQNCVSLQHINLPAQVRDIQPRAWIGCQSLKSFSVAASNEYYASKDGVLFDKYFTTLICYPAYRNASSYKLPQSIKLIYPYAFDASLLLSDVTLPEQLRRLREHAFNDCPMLRSVTVPQNIEMIKHEAFWNCKELSQANLPARFQQEYNRIFTNCPLMKKE